MTNMARRSKLDIESYVNELAQTVVADPEPVMKSQLDPLESVLKGVTVELWTDTAGRLFIVADEDDVVRLGEPRGSVYTAAEVRRVVQIGDPALVHEIHEWKRTFNGIIQDQARS